LTDFSKDAATTLAAERRVPHFVLSFPRASLNAFTVECLDLVRLRRLSEVTTAVPAAAEKGREGVFIALL